MVVVMLLSGVAAHELLRVRTRPSCSACQATDGRSLASDALEFVDIMPTLVEAAAPAITAKRGNSGGEIGGGGDGGGGGGGENGGEAA